MTGFKGISNLKACEYSYPNFMNLHSAKRYSLRYLAVNMA